MGLLAEDFDKCTLIDGQFGDSAGRNELKNVF